VDTDFLASISSLVVMISKPSKFVLFFLIFYLSNIAQLNRGKVFLLQKQ
jgi:hypothetical protein